MGAIPRPAAEVDTRRNGFSAEERADLDAPEFGRKSMLSWRRSND